MLYQKYLLGFCILIESMRVFQSSLQSIRSERSNPNQTLFDVNKIQQSKKMICIGLGLYVSQTVVQRANPLNINATSFIHDVLLSVSQMFLWHNITLNVKLLRIFQHDPFPPTNRNDEDNDQLIELMKNEGIRNDVNMYLRNIPNPTIDQRGAYSYLTTACTKNAAGSLNMYLKNHEYNVMLIASLMAHEIGHQLGFFHADRHPITCECGFPREYCLGSPLQLEVDSDIPKSFENCLIEKLENSIQSFPCLQQCNLDNKMALCGDGIIDDNEECDCGFDENCKLNLQDKCCDPKTCKLRDSNFQCASGECCENCTFSDYKTCRSNFNGNVTNGVCTGSSSKCEIEMSTLSTPEPKSPELPSQHTIKDQRDQICRYYFDKDSFFSERCYVRIMRYLQYHCSRYRPGSQFYDGHCEEGLTMCDYLICEGNEINPTEKHVTVNYPTFHCSYYMPRQKLSKNIGGHNGIKCEGSNNVCFEGTCLDVKNILKSDSSSSDYLSHNGVPSGYNLQIKNN